VEISPIRSLASVRGTNAPSVIYPTRKPMGNATWDDELDDETETASNNIFGTLEVVGKGMSTFVDVSNMLLQDAPEVENEVRAALVEDFEKKETTAFTNGNGVAQPEGFMTNTSVLEFNNGHASVLQADALVKFLYSIAPTYRNAGVWVMNGTTLGIVRLLKDGQGNYLWQPSYQAGQPETILGRPIVEIIDMPDLAANAFPIAYGDFSGYRILDRLSLSLLVDPYTRATQKQTRYHAGRRVGGKVIMPAKFKKLKIAV
jgi:HK97 family phage major capsid protein